ncbi:hypothetical protein ATO67_02770 [Agrobacterium bohemicum]|uniref:Uncharacterized protein n=1 Tax=Agrobacterium bohemicum TaxID=2052828 RepID=A0A135P4V0_9HYPH|nr:hypothetical protein ATO67_02770 [Agrobacterium bohemicum]
MKRISSLVNQEVRFCCGFTVGATVYITEIGKTTIATMPHIEYTMRQNSGVSGMLPITLFQKKRRSFHFAAA